MNGFTQRLRDIELAAMRVSMKKLFCAFCLYLFTSSGVLADRWILGREAEEIIRRGNILAQDAVVERDIVHRHLLIEYESRLYSCYQAMIGLRLDIYCMLDEPE